MEQFSDDDGTLVVRGELPGLDPDNDVTIVVDADRLKISGTPRRTVGGHDRRDVPDGVPLRLVRAVGRVCRRAPVPTTSPPAYTDGILEVRVPIDDGRIGDHEHPDRQTS